MSKNQANLQSLVLRCVTVFAVGILAVASRAMAEVPQQINHQGVVSVNGERFDGAGLFRFAIVDPDTGVNLWTNDGTQEGEVGGVPDNPVSLPVTGGIYSLGLGDTGLANMTPIPSSVFNDDNAVLRIWFDDGANGIQQLTPDHKLTASPYSHRADNGVPTGGIIMWSGGLGAIPSGWALCDGTNGTPDLRNRFVYGVDTAENPGATGGSVDHWHAVPVGNTGGGRLAHADGPPWISSGQLFSSTWKVARDNTTFETVEGLRNSVEGHLPPFFKLAFIMKLATP